MWRANPEFSVTVGDCDIRSNYFTNHDFISDPPSNSVCPTNSISKDHITKIDQEISSLLKKKVIVASSHEPGEYISPIFSVPKKDSKVRLILNLKRLNKHVRSFHFKMDSIHTAVSLVTEVGKHVKIMIDNTTALSVINNKGTSHNDQCSDVACDIWNLCEENSIWLTAAYIPSKDNIIADRESRNKNVDTEWMLNSRFLMLVLKHFNFLPCIDLFASRVNKQFNTYVSYKPDPYAKHIDAFTISWSTEAFYCFPPFSCITNVIRKIIQDQARGILVVPDWPTQAWYPLLLPILEQPPYHLPPSADLLTMLSQANLHHQLQAKMNLLICLVSGKNYK